MIPIATVYVPYSPAHAQLRFRAIESVYAQTVKCDVQCAPSPNTPATFRNKALNCKSEFVIFLDADDLLAPTFIEECLGVYQQGRYVYTTWREGEILRVPKPCAWSGESHHIVTTLYPTVFFQYFGGFNEQLPGHEDADFYMRSYANRICGIHLDKPLVIRPDDTGERSKAFHKRADYQDILVSVAEHNGGMTKIMGCCGQPGTPAPRNPGEELAGDVLAETLWGGMHTEYSPYTERLYTGGNGVVIYVAAKDVEKFPNLFRKVKDLRELAPTRERVLRESGLV